MPINLSGNTIYSSGVTTNGDYTKRIVKQDLKIYLDANIPASANVGNGVWLDLSGHGNHCDWNVEPAFTSSAGRNWFSFTLATHYGTITNNASLDFSKEQTVMMMLMKTSNSVRRNPWNQAYGGYGTWTDEDTPDDYINHFWGDAGSDTTPYVSARSEGRPLGVWKFAGVTRDQQRGIAYMDGRRGTRFGEAAASGYSTVVHTYGTLTSTAANITIGDGYAGNWYGRIAMVLAYTRALEPYEMAQNFQAIRHIYGL